MLDQCVKVLHDGTFCRPTETFHEKSRGRILVRFKPNPHKKYSFSEPRQKRIRADRRKLQVHKNDTRGRNFFWKPEKNVRTSVFKWKKRYWNRLFESDRQTPQFAQKSVIAREKQRLCCSLWTISLGHFTENNLFDRKTLILFPIIYKGNPN